MTLNDFFSRIFMLYFGNAPFINDEHMLIGDRAFS
jgi:hypothetical protein